MGAVQLPDELLLMIERQVEEGRATSAAAFLEEAVLRLIDDARSEEDEIREVVQAGIADMQAGRYTTIATPEDEKRLRERMMARLHQNLAAKA